MKQVRFKFGDIIDNGWAGEKNPTKKGIFVRHKRWTIELTDGKGKFWEVRHKADHRNTRIGSIYDNSEAENERLQAELELYRKYFKKVHDELEKEDSADESIENILRLNTQLLISLAALEAAE
ncbi:hypothetical protein SFC17_12770 [Bacillus paralicheniformis]|uniref:hypothetical protein n=1 Tax=Bacillus paralicheniformis TaxID=1648923 RepID=UPI003981D13C